MLDKVQFGHRLDITLDEAIEKRKIQCNVNHDSRIKGMPVRKLIENMS